MAFNEQTAKGFAATHGIAVSSTKKTQLAGRTYMGKPAIRHEMKVGRAVCYYETDRGGAACWMVELDGVTTRAGYKSDAIYKATRAQLA